MIMARSVQSTSEMFTGLVQAVGELRPIPAGVGVRCHGELAPLALGDSVAVDGVCLTVRRLCSDGFEADVSGETLRRTALGAKARLGGWVNLEPALRLSDRLGGHLVSGHVDGLGEVLALEHQGHSWRLELAWQDPALGRYICDKASVAVNGISLTVAGCSAAGSRFWVAVIPHTWEHTTLARLRLGDAVHLEADLLAKYVERLLGQGQLPGAPKGSSATLTSSWLAEQGWAS